MKYPKTALVFGLLVIAGCLGYAVSRVAFERTSPRMPFQQAAWMPEESSGAYSRLMNEVIDRPRWSAEEASFLLSLMRTPLDDNVPPGFDDIAVPRADDRPEVVNRFLERPGSQEALEWFFVQGARDMAWAEVQDRLSAGKDIPQELRDSALEGWVAMLDGPDAYRRMAGATALVATGLFRQTPQLEVRIEALRVGDPSADVRSAIDRRIQHYDRVYHGIEPDGATSDCNTCP